jgi:hypothetical protein
MKNHVYLLLLSLWLIPACKKSALTVAGGNTLDKTVMTIPGTPLIQYVDSFVYDGQQRLAEVIYSGSDPAPFADTVTLQYDVSGRVASWTMIFGGQGRVITYELSYDGNGRLVKSMAVPLLPNYDFSDYSYAYNTQGQLVTDTVFAQHGAGVPSPGIMSYDNWTYDENGNAIADQLFVSSNTGLVGAPFTAGIPDTYRYDTQVNPYYHAGIPFFSNYGFGPQLLSPNNLVGGTTSGTSALSPYTYSYAYYSNGRPRVQTTAVYGASGMETQTTAYFYQ